MKFRTSKKLHEALKEYFYAMTLKDTKPKILYNFLSNRYWVVWYCSDFLVNKLSKSHEVIF